LIFIDFYRFLALFTKFWFFLDTFFKTHYFVAYTGLDFLLKNTIFREIIVFYRFLALFRDRPKNL